MARTQSNPKSGQKSERTTKLENTLRKHAKELSRKKAELSSKEQQSKLGGDQLKDVIEEKKAHEKKFCEKMEEQEELEKTVNKLNGKLLKPRADFEKGNRDLQNVQRKLRTENQASCSAVNNVEEFEALNKLKDCPICMDTYNNARVPLVLRCGHTLCSVCCQGLVRTNQNLICPTCRKDCKVTSRDQIKNLPQSQFVIDFMQNC